MRTGARKRRRDLLLTLHQASALAGCSTSSLSRWERGDAPVPEPYWRGIEDMLGQTSAEVWRGVREGAGR